MTPLETTESVKTKGTRAPRRAKPGLESPAVEPTSQGIGTLTVESQETLDRVSRRRNRRKLEIVHVATKVLARSGYERMSLDEVAQEVDIAKPTLYHYFASKDELVAECLETLTIEVLARLEAAVDAKKDASAREQLGALVLEQVRILTIYYPEVGQLFGWPWEAPTDHRQSMRSMRQRHDAIFKAVIDRGMASGELRCENPEMSRHCLHGALNHASVWYRPVANPIENDQRLAELADSVIRMFIGV